ncbi:hypothetical protein [Advenella alkanexedens]|uniref:hypothetical protein n=1 Tax=Advenella alkanexedens TaxID=1481665 RepID=UPI00267620F1|nr:hypothetical protein [Advenella alkanexedens]WKU20898.1 hypothetical protein Q3V95_06760 [Advenella alkanexedens]
MAAVKADVKKLAKISTIAKVLLISSGKNSHSNIYFHPFSKFDRQQKNPFSSAEGVFME